MLDRLSSISSESSNPSTCGQYPSCVCCFDHTILPAQRNLSRTENKRLTTTAVILVIITLIFALALTIFGFFTSQQSDSSAMFGFAFDSFFAVVSSCILIWRFYHSEAEDNYTVARRETHATVVVAICMIVSSIAIFVRAIESLYHSHKLEKPMALLILAGVSAVIYSVLFVSTYKVAKKLGSAALLTDAMDSLWGVTFSLGILICDFIVKLVSEVWFLDSTVAIIVALCSFIYGSIVLEKLIRLFDQREEAALMEYQEELCALEEQEAKDSHKKQSK